jgi:acetyl esterase/lipase
VTLLAAATLSGCMSLTFAIANAPATFGSYSVTRDVAYADGRSRTLDVYRPSTLAEARPVLVFFHGGGWVAGAKREYRFVADALTSRGFIVVIPEYRLYPAAKFPGFVADAAQAIAWVHTHANEIGGDAQRVFIMGHSAGAHIAAMVTYDEHFLRDAGGDSSWLHGFIGLSGPYDFLPLRDPELERVFAPEDKYPDSQPVNFVDGKEPPALLLHGRADQTVWPMNSEHLAARIREHGGSVTEHYYDGMSHGGTVAAMSVYYRKRSTVLQDIVEFVER